MTATLTEEEMRQALFGSAPSPSQQSKTSTAPAVFAAGSAKPVASKPAGVKSRVSAKLRVILHVTREFEGATEVFTYDANTLSTLLAEQEAKAAAKKKKFRYLEVASIKPIG